MVKIVSVTVNGRSVYPEPQLHDGISTRECYSRWQQNRRSLETDGKLLFDLTPAQIAAAKGSTAYEAMRVYEATQLRKRIAAADAIAESREPRIICEGELDAEDLATPTKLFFQFTDDADVTYAVVATSLQHAEQILRDSGAEFGREGLSYDEKMEFAPMAGWGWGQISAERAAEIHIDAGDDGRGRIKLSEANIGEWFCSEY